jgi:hypothetical protein
MSIFKRDAGPQKSAAPTAGVVPPASSPTYKLRSTAELLAEKARLARGAQQNVQEKVRIGVQQVRPTPPPSEACRRSGATQRFTTTPLLTHDPVACAQAGLLNLARMWLAADAPMRAIHTYLEVLTRYPDTQVAADAVADLVELSEKLAGEGQFHAALGIYDHLEYLA